MVIQVLHIYSGNLFGGIETLLVTLAQEQSQCPQMVHQFALCFEGRLATALDAANGIVHPLGNVRVSRPWTVWAARKRLDQLLCRHTFDVVVCHACWSQAIFAPVVRSHRLPLVFWCHDTPKGTHWLEQWAKRTPPDLAIANSHYTSNTLPALYPQVNRTVLYLPVRPPGSFDPVSTRVAIRAELNTPSQAIVIMQAARLERWKGQTLLLAALYHLKDVPNWVCWIAGGAQRPHEVEYLHELQERAQELGMGDRIRFLGHRTDVPQLLVAADIHCQPNIEPEPFGIAFIEAMYAGLPVVTTAMGAAIELVKQSCGHLIQPEDVDGLSQTLTRLIRNPAERQQLGDGGKAQAEFLCHPSRQLTSLYTLLVQLIQCRSAT